jgi:gp21 protein
MFLQVNKLIENYEHIYLDLDDRNKAVENLKALEEYLQTKLCVERNKIPDINVQFFDSSQIH